MVSYLNIKIDSLNFLQLLNNYFGRLFSDSFIRIFFPYYSIKCQANMEEYSKEENTKCFGLEVIFYRDLSVKSQILTNYIHRVGSSIKSKFIRPGKVIIELKSRCFEADLNAGEESLIKEYFFEGMDFITQFNCVFNPEINFERGTFGKVIVKKENNNEILFEFNLQKSGTEGEGESRVSYENESVWSDIFYKELSSNFLLNEDDNWKFLAKEIGLTKKEIRKQVKHSYDRLLEIKTIFIKRGGSPNEFIQKMYSATREINLEREGRVRENRSRSRRIRRSSETETAFSTRKYTRDEYFGRESAETDILAFEDLIEEKTPHQIQQRNISPFARKRKLQQQIQPLDQLAVKKRRLFPDNSAEKDDSFTYENEQNNSNVDTESELDVTIDIMDTNENEKKDDDDALSRISTITTKSSFRYRNDGTKLEQKYLWEISSYMNTSNWKNLGRTLGLEEGTLVNIEQSYKNTSLREFSYQTLNEWRQQFPHKCTFGTLYSALCKEDMKLVAKKMLDVDA